MKNKKGNIAIIAVVVIVVAIITGTIGWLFAKRNQTLVQQKADNTIKPVEQKKTVNETNLPATSESIQSNATIPIESNVTKQESNLQKNVVQPAVTQSATIQSNAKVSIVLIIKSQGGTLMKGVTCAVKADEGASRMIPEVSEKSNSKGICDFQNLDPAFPYLVRIYWTEDHSRVTDLSLSWIPAGTTVARTVVKPAGM